MSEENVSVEDLLSRVPALVRIGGVSIPTSRELPLHVSYGEGQPGSGRVTRPMVPLVIGGVLCVLGLVFLVQILRAGGGDMNLTMAVILCFGIAAFIGGPALFKMRQGRLQWTRTAEIGPDMVRVTDRTDAASTEWAEPISAYSDIYHRFERLDGGETRDVQLEVVELRHPNPGRTIYVLGTRKTAMGGMSFADMVQAGRDGRKADVEAAVGDTRNPQVEAVVAALAEGTGLPLTQEFG